MCHVLSFWYSTVISSVAYTAGAVIAQNNKPIAFYIRKLRDGQHNYTTTGRDSSEDYLATQKNELPADIYPLQMSLLSSEQHKDTSIQNTLRDRNSNYIRKEVRGGSKRNEVVFCNGKIVADVIFTLNFFFWNWLTISKKFKK